MNGLEHFEQNFLAELQQKEHTILQNMQRLEQRMNKIFMKGMMMGGLVIIIVILSLLVMVLSWKSQQLYTELAEIKANIEQTPTQAKILAKGDGERWQTIHHQQDKQSGCMAKYRQTESNGAKINEPIFNTLQCINARLRATSERTSTYSRATTQAHRATDERKQVAVGAVEHCTRTEQTITSVSREVEHREQQTAEINLAVRETEQALGKDIER